MKKRTALIIAAECGERRIVALLLADGAKAELKDSRGWSALEKRDKGQDSVYEEIVQLLEVALPRLEIV